MGKFSCKSKVDFSQRQTMPSTNDATLENSDLSDFFGGAWDFAPNGTFNDLIDPQSLEMPSLDQGVENTNAFQQRNLPPQKMQTGSAEVPVSPGSNVTSKPKPPNLFETLRRGSMHPMMMSPYGGYADFMNMDWSPPMMPTGMDYSGNAMFPTSPAMMDPNQLMMMQRMKRPRISPVMGGMDFMPSYGMGMMPMGMFNRRQVKMPLSPVPKTEKKVMPPETSEKMPIVLPFSSGPTESYKAKPKPPPIRLLPAKNTIQESKVMPTGTIEENMEKNIRSFLKETRDLEWENVTVIELKKILRQYELNATGKKAELMQRITKIRKTYRHLDEDYGTETEASAKSYRDMLEKNLTDSSPDSMGSEPGAMNSNASDSIETFFSSTLDLPMGRDLIFLKE